MHRVVHALIAEFRGDAKTLQSLAPQSAPKVFSTANSLKE
jgi:hypothetical protein